MANPDGTPVSAQRRWRILGYCGVIVVALNFITPVAGIHIIPLSFILKNRLHLSASALATFTLWVGLPAYFSFAFGIVRDFWSPFGRGDRGYFILFGALSALLFAAFAFLPVSQISLFAVAVLSTVSFLFLWSGWNGLSATIGQQHAMSGQMSALWNFAGTSAITASIFLSGVFSGKLETLSTQGAVRVLFFVVAAIMAIIAALGFWKPAAVYDGLRRGGAESDFLADMKRLVRHWPLYPALTIWLLWNFSPGTQTVLQYYMSNALHASDAQWGAYNAIFFGVSIPAFALFGFLSSRLSLQTLLWIGAALGTTQMLPLLFIHSAGGVLIAAVPIGLSGGIATAAYLDLLIRSCPKGLEGSMMMLSWSMYAIVTNFGNLWGTNLYEYHGGFVACVIATTLVYALVLPVILLVPKRLIVNADAGGA